MVNRDVFTRVSVTEEIYYMHIETTLLWEYIVFTVSQPNAK